MKQIDLSGFPLPIYVSYLDFANAKDNTTRFRSGMRFFTTILKYCSISAIADYLDYLEKGGEPDPELTNLLYSNLFRPSLGHWNHFLRELLLLKRKINTSDSGFLFELDKAYFKKRNKATPNKLAKLFNELIAIRNEWFHPGIDPDENNAPGLVEDVVDKLAEAIELLGFIKQHNLFHYKDGSKNLLMGDVTSAWTEDEIEQLNFKERQLFLEIEEGKEIPLNFLIELKNAHNSSENHFMLFETARINKKKSVQLVKFILGNQWGFDERLYLDLANNVQKILRLEKKEEIAPVAEITWPHLLSVTQNLLKENRRELEESGKVIPSLYVNRTHIDGEDGAFEKFIDSSSDRCLVILGDSGHGKTNTMWKLLTHPEVRSRKNNLALFFMEARNIHPQGLTKEIDQALYLEGGLKSTLAALEKQSGNFVDKQLICFIDAINEYHAPATLMREILDLTSKQNPNFKVVVSCRSIAWARILVTLTNKQEELIFSQIDDGEKKYPSLARYNQAELEIAYKNYQEKYGIATGIKELSPRSLNLLTDPLMLRLTTEAYSQGAEGNASIPNELNIATIFSKYDIKAHIDRDRDEPFLNELIAAMWNNHLSIISGKEIRNSALIQEIVYAAPVSMIPGATWLCDNCKTILTIGQDDFSADDPCPICDSMSVKPVQKDWRTTYERLLDEGILTEDLTGEDIALRFVYDRYYEYKTAGWLLQQNQSWDIKQIKEMIDHVQKGDAPILLEALKLAIRLSDSCEQIVLQLAASGDQVLADTATGIISSMARGEDAPLAEKIIQTLTNNSPEERIVAINSAVAAGSIADVALLTAIPKKEGTEIVSAAISKALYLIWRKKPDRADELMKKMGDSISATKITKEGPARFMVLIEVTFKVLGVLHHKINIVESLGEFWVKIINHNLGLGRTTFPFKLLSKSLRWTLINVVSLFANSQFKRHGVSFGKDDKAFTEAEKKAVVTLLEAWTPGSGALDKVPEIVLNFGPNATDETQRSRICASVVSFFMIPACVAGMSHDPIKTMSIYKQVFTEAGNLPDKGRATRFFTYSGVNFGLQLNYPKMMPDLVGSVHALQPVYDSLHGWFLELLENDPEIFAKAEIIEGTTNSSFGIHMQSAARVDADLISEIVKPMIEKAKQGHPDLLKAYLRVSMFSLDTFSQRVSAHMNVLRSLEYITNIKDLPTQIGLNEKTYKQLIVEAYAVVSIGFPTDTELFVVKNNKLPQGFLELMRQAKSKTSVLFDLPEDSTLEKFINSTLQGWAMSDGGNSLLIHFPKIRNLIVKYFDEAVDTGDIRVVLKNCIKDLLEFLMVEGKK